MACRRCHAAARSGSKARVASSSLRLGDRTRRPGTGITRLTRPPASRIVSASCTPPDLAPALATATGSRVAARALRACQPDVRRTSSASPKPRSLRDRGFCFGFGGARLQPRRKNVNELSSRASATDGTEGARREGSRFPEVNQDPSLALGSQARLALPRDDKHWEG
jgi:hypothetical protein